MCAPRPDSGFPIKVNRETEALVTKTFPVVIMSSVVLFVYRLFENVKRVGICLSFGLYFLGQDKFVVAASLVICSFVSVQ